MKSIRELYHLYLDSTGIDTDSRNIRPGSIFAALRGDKFDGNKYALNAIEQGAMYAIVDADSGIEHPQAIPTNLPVLRVLQSLATYHRLQFDIPVLGLTGSNGKTTTKELLACVLAKKYKVHYTKGNLNNHIGVPLTLLSMAKAAEIAIIEMGANHQKEIKQLCEIALPTHGMITNIGKAHLEGFGGPEGVIKGKKELYDWLIQQEGHIFYNSDDVLLSELVAPYLSKTAYQPSAYKTTGTKSIALQNKNQTIKTQLSGHYNAMNIVAALKVGQYFGVSPTKAAEAIACYEPRNNRSQLVQIGSNTIILDAYNANPSSMKLSIENLIHIEGERLAILGDMLELGEASKQEHQAIVDLLIRTNTQALLVGKHWPIDGHEFPIYPSIKELDFTKYTKDLRNTSILIKGSRSIGLEKLLEKRN